MSDEIRLTRDRDRGVRAERLLADELVTEAFAALERDYIAAWKDTPARDTDARERLWQAVQINGKVKAHLSRVAADGTLAARELDEIARMGERKKVLGVF